MNGPHAQTLPLTIPSPDVLAMGAWLKNTACAIHGMSATISSLIGDLDQPQACLALEQFVDEWCEHENFEPQAVAHDLHPDFYSTRLAQAVAGRNGIPAIGVQHHHAHIAAVCAEHGVTTPVLGLGLDGIGYGTDGTAWGGELLRVDGSRFDRLSHLYPLKLPGGDRAAREPWRMAAAALESLDCSNEIAKRFDFQAGAAMVATMLRNAFNCQPTSSMGRLFDAAAGLLGICPVQTFEGEAAMKLQALAEQYGEVEPMPDGYFLADVLDFRPLLMRLAEGGEAGALAALFHATLAQGLADWVAGQSKRQSIQTVACGGGCFFNRLLLSEFSVRMEARGIRVLTAQQLSPGDSGLSLGQAWVAAHYLQEKH
jgi:hydrogenase maturation protein HypF